MTQLAKNKDMPRKEGAVQSFPVENNVHIYKGALVCINAAGYAVPAADAVSYRFVGIAYEECDNTLAGRSQGGKSVRVYRTGVFLLTCTNITQAMVGQMMYVTDDQTVDDTTGGTYYIPVGRLVEYVSQASGWVDIAQRHLVGGADDVLLAPNATNMLEVHTWGVVVKAVAGSCSLYLAADYGAYLNSWATGSLEMCAAIALRLRIGGKGCDLDSTGVLKSPYGFTISSGVIGVASGGTGCVLLSHKTDPVTQPDEGKIWYNSSQKKLQFATDSGMETVTSS